MPNTTPQMREEYHYTVFGLGETTCLKGILRLTYILTKSENIHYVVNRNANYSCMIKYQKAFHKNFGIPESLNLELTMFFNNEEYVVLVFVQF